MNLVINGHNLDGYNSLQDFYQNRIDITNIYRDNNVFLEMKKILKKITPIKTLNPILSGHLNTSQRENLIKLLNMFILVNLIKKSLKNKSQQNIIIFDLVVKLNAIVIEQQNQTTVQLLQLYFLNNAFDELALNQDIESYTYRNINPIYLSGIITQETYNKIYNLFHLFM